MVKRGLQDGEENMDVKAQFGERRINKDDPDVEMGEFEDPWEDELEEEEDIIDGEEYVEDDDDDESTTLECGKKAELICRNGGYR
jgi:hypothetical protein